MISQIKLFVIFRRGCFKRYLFETALFRKEDYANFFILSCFDDVTIWAYFIG